MAFESRIASPFVMVQADLAFVVLPALLTRHREKAAKGSFLPTPPACVAHEKLHLRWIETML